MREAIFNLNVGFPCPSTNSHGPTNWHNLTILL